MSDRQSQRQPAHRRGLAFILSILLAFVAFPHTSARMQESSGDGGTFNAHQKGDSPAEFVPGEALVRFRAGAQATRAKFTQMNVRSSVGSEIPVEVEDVEGFEIVKDLRLAHVAPADTLKAIAALNARPDVLYAEPNYILHKEQAALAPNDARYGDLWGLKNTGQTGNNDVAPVQPAPQAGVVGADIKAEQAWGSFTTGSRSVVVAVIDEGVDITHPDLQANIWTNPGEVPNDGVDNDGDGFIDDVNGWDFVHNDKTVFDNTSGAYPAPGTYTGDVDDHGTHVSGTIGAVGNNGQGIAGVNWQISIMSVKVLGKGGGSTANIIKGYNYVRMMKDRGINVRATNNSYGGAGFSQSSFNAISALNDSGILLVAAAGNETANSAEFSHYPSDYNLPNVIPVAATDRFEQLAVFSNYGTENILLAAPGRGILSTTPFNTYNFFSGTSMATPHVAGAAALCLAAFPNVSIYALRNALIFSGDVIPSLAGKVYSQRRLNVFKTLQTLAENDQTAPESFFDFHVVSQNGRAVTLGWTATGDDGNAGQAALYEIRFDSTFIATKIPQPAGTAETVTVNVPYHLSPIYLSVNVVDNVGFNRTGGVVQISSPPSAVEPYNVALSAPEVLSTGGTPLGVIGDDVFKEGVALPFAFPFYGVNQTSLTVSSNGALYFSKLQRDKDDTTGQLIGLDAFSSVNELTRHKMIAGMWDDLATDGSDVFMLQPAANRVIFRWQGKAFDNGQPINFETELRSDGTIINRYGGGNTGLYSVVGISPGEPVPYTVPSHLSERGVTSRINLTNAQTVTFAPRASLPNKAPNVRLSSPTNGLTLLQPANVTVTVNASDDDGSISKVELFNGQTLIGTLPGNASGNQYTFQWSNVLAGNYTLTAVATDDAGAASTSNPIAVTITNNQIDGSDFFVRQHYTDFLNRQPDASGLAFWTNNIESCGFDAQCREIKRIDTSAAFFLSIEFQQTGYLVYRGYKAAFGNLPNKPVPLTRAEFVPDTQAIGQSVIVGQTGWEQVLESNKVAYFNSFVARTRFTTLYPQGMAAATYVDTLFANAGVTPTVTERQNAITAYGAGDNAGRAAALRGVAESQTLQHSEFNKAFVLMQYFGYLSRDPDAAPDTNFDGYNFWLSKLNEFGGDFRRAEMVKAFLSSSEYRGRFGS